VSLSETSCVDFPCCYSGIRWRIISFFILGMSLYVTFQDSPCTYLIHSSRPLCVLYVVIDVFSF
jgi:hypothetical protein